MSASALGDLGPPLCCADGGGEGESASMFWDRCAAYGLELCGQSGGWKIPPWAGGFRSSGLVLLFPIACAAETPPAVGFTC